MVDAKEEFVGLSQMINRKAGLYALGRLKTGELNKTESAYAQTLEAQKASGEVLWYAFEGVKLKLANNTHLTIDFAVMNKDGVLEMIDVKGSKAIFMDDSKAKIKIAASMFPFIFKVAYPKAKRDGGGWLIEEI